MTKKHSDFFKMHFEKFPHFNRYVSISHQIILKFSKAAWAQDPYCLDYEMAHISVCEALYSFSETTNEMDDPALLGIITSSELRFIARMINADPDTLTTQFSQMLN